MNGLFLLVVLAAAQDGTVGPDTPRRSEGASTRATDAVLAWNDLALEAIRKGKTPPPVAARNLAILHVAIADTVATIHPDYQPYRIGLRAIENIDPHAAVAACGHRVLSSLYPAQGKTFDLARERALAGIGTGRARSLGVTLGEYVADRILAWRRDDGATRTVSYRASLDPGVWRPTAPAYAAALLPRFGDLAPFGVKDRRRIRCNPPPELGSEEYTKDYDEVRRLGQFKSRTRTAEQSIIAWFWNDAAGTCTPPGHWNQIAREVSVQRKRTLTENARLFALLNIALADAAIFCWDCKYRYRLWRPITAIANADRDGNPETMAERDWKSLLDTPPFPSYTSGHSTFSGAGATILARYFGNDDVEFTVGSDGFPGMERTFKGFWEAAQEAGRSRIYGGIHFECDNREGLALGKAIAEEVYRSRLRLDDPTTPPGTVPEDRTKPRPLTPDGPEKKSIPASSRRERP